jgi:hypothetical protein
MDDAERPRQAPDPTLATAPGHLRWDTSELRRHNCAVATATATRDEIILNFGAKTGRDYRGGEVAVELLQRIAVNPLTAKHLLGMLQKLIADDDARLPPPS